MRVAERLRVPHPEDGRRKGTCESQSDCECRQGVWVLQRGCAGNRVWAGNRAWAGNRVWVPLGGWRRCKKDKHSAWATMSTLPAGSTAARMSFPFESSS
eukprot:193370-Chlamydomonas_euryale.AAC.1